MGARGVEVAVAGQHAQPWVGGRDQVRKPVHVAHRVGQGRTLQRHAGGSPPERSAVGHELVGVGRGGELLAQEGGLQRRLGQGGQPVLAAVDVGLVPDLEPEDAPGRQRLLGGAGPLRCTVGGSGDQVQVDDQLQVFVAHESARSRQERRRQPEHPPRHRFVPRVPERVVGGIAADSEHERPVPAHVQERENALEQRHMAFVVRKRPVLGRKPEERARNGKGPQLPPGLDHGIDRAGQELGGDRRQRTPRRGCRGVGLRPRDGAVMIGQRQQGDERQGDQRQRRQHDGAPTVGTTPAGGTPGCRLVRRTHSLGGGSSRGPENR